MYFRFGRHVHRTSPFSEKVDMIFLSVATDFSPWLSWIFPRFLSYAPFKKWNPTNYVSSLFPDYYLLFQLKLKS